MEKERDKVMYVSIIAAAQNRETSIHNNIRMHTFNHAIHNICLFQFADKQTLRRATKA
jgi:hypothetical protein